LLYAFRNPLGCSGWTTLLPIAVGGLGIAALTLQKTWSVLLLLPAIAIEALYGWQLHAAASLQAAPALVLAATIASLLLLAPVLLGIWRFLRQRTPPDAPRQRMAERGDNE